MIAEVEVRDAEILLKLRNGEKRMVYAIGNAVNETAKAAQRAVRQHVSQNFTLRSKREFILRSAAKITFARPARGIIEAKVAVDTKPGLLLAGYEAGFTREPRRGTRVAVPALEGARPTKTADIPSNLLIKALMLRRAPGRRRSKGGRLAPIRGLQGSFVLPGGIFQRVAGAVRALYLFARPFPVKPRLGFIATAKAEIERVFPAQLLVEIRRTLEFKR